MTLQQLVHFCEIAKTSNFTKAAGNLYLSQSSLSHSIIALERELGSPLFIRNSGKSISLTGFGQKLLPYAEKVLDDVAGITAFSQREMNPRQGVVTVAYSFVNGYYMIPDLFADFLGDPTNENVTLDFDITHGIRPIEPRVLSGEVDIAFNATTGVKGISTCQIATQKLWLCVPASHQLAGKNSVTIYDFMNEPFIFYHPVSKLREQIIKMFANVGAKPNEIATYNDWSSHIAAISIGKGVGITSRLPVDPSRLTLLPIDDALAVRPIYMLWAEGRSLPAVVEYVKKCCVEKARQLPMTY